MNLLAFYPRSASGVKTAAALHANVLEGTSDKWMPTDAPTHPPRFIRHVLGAGRLLPETKPMKHFADVMSVAPNTFFKPQPRPSLSRILNWQDQTERCSPQSKTNSARKGIIEKILLVAGRRRLENEESNKAPAWPPASELIANPPNWGRKATLPAPGLSLGLNIAFPIASTVSAGHFIGRDGTEWPLPPAECMTKPSPSPIAPPRVLPALTLNGDKLTTPIMTLDHVEDADAPFVASGAELHAKHGTHSCSTAATSLPRTPVDDVVLLPVRKANWKAKVECDPRCGVIGEGRPKPGCPPTPFLGPSLRLPSPPFLASQAAYVESESESVGGYWSESESGSEHSEYTEADWDDFDAWSRSDVSSDSDEESEYEPEFFVARDGTAWPLPPAELAAAAAAVHRGRNPVPRW